jgi:hypothetical protein
LASTASQSRNRQPAISLYDVELASKDLRAGVVLLDGVEQVSALHVQTHQRPMHRLLERIDPQ